MKPYNFCQEILYIFSERYFISPVCLTFSLFHYVCDILQCPPLSVALYEVWGWARPPHDRPHLTTSDTETRAGTLDTTSASWRNFSDTLDISQIWYYRGKLVSIESMHYFWGLILLDTSFMFMPVCHIIAATSCCSLGARCQQWPVSRQRHSGLATSSTGGENMKWTGTSPGFTEKSSLCH